MFAVLAEKDDLSKKLSELVFYIHSAAFEGLSKTEQFLLEEQLQYMEKYLVVLEERIAISKLTQEKEKSQ